MKAFARAESILRESLAAREQAFPTDRRTLLNQWALAEALIGLGRIPEANSAVTEACAMLTTRFATLPGSGRARLRVVANRLVHLAIEAGAPELATAWAAKFEEFGLAPAAARN